MLAIEWKKADTDRGSMRWLNNVSIKLLYDHGLRSCWKCCLWHNICNNDLIHSSRQSLKLIFHDFLNKLLYVDLSDLETGMDCFINCTIQVSVEIKVSHIQNGSMMVIVVYRLSIQWTHSVKPTPIIFFCVLSRYSAEYHSIFLQITVPTKGPQSNVHILLWIYCYI